MARITAGVGTSHVPLLGVAADFGKDKDDYFAPIFAGYEWTKAWEREQKPDVVILVYNDHASAFDMKIIPTFAIGCGESYQPADEVKKKHAFLVLRNSTLQSNSCWKAELLCCG